ncbi:MAG: VOC family protein [Devosiaceae bacterium]|nr:VOC family protein [Devosiaceae bacterium]
MKFRYAILYVRDVKSTLDFYVNAFGMTKKMLHESGGYGELDTGDTVLAFASVAAMADKGATLANVKSPSFEIAFETDDVTRDIEKAIAAGAKLVQEPRHMDWGQTVAYVSDADGFLIEICTPIG